MANKSDLDSFLMQCARKYAENHPEERVSLIQQTKVPVDCTYCGGRTDLYRIPFTDARTYIDTENGCIVAKCDCERTQMFKINYCPKCGRKIN